MNDGVERVAFAEARRFVKKDRTKLKLVLGLYALSLKNKELGKTLRSAYFFARHLDDLLDGEMGGVADPVGYVSSLREQIITGEFESDPPITKLVKSALPALERKAKPEDNPRLEFVQLIDALLFDHERIQERRTLSTSELSSYYNQVLAPGLNLTLINFESELRASDIPEFAPSLGRLYSIRDLRKDWQLGVINIPQEVLSASELTAFSSYEHVATNSLVAGWAEREVMDATMTMRTTQQQFNGLNEPFTKRIVNGLANQAIAESFIP